MSGGKLKKSLLWLARKRKGLQQKQVARLMGRRTVNKLSSYETNAKLPNLRTALKFEIIYGVPVQELFNDLYMELLSEINLRAASSKSEELSLALSGYCSHSALLNSPHPSKVDISIVRDHVTDLAKRMNEYL